MKQKWVAISLSLCVTLTSCMPIVSSAESLDEGIVTVSDVTEGTEEISYSDETEEITKYEETADVLPNEDTDLQIEEDIIHDQEQDINESAAEEIVIDSDADADTMSTSIVDNTYNAMLTEGETEGESSNTDAEGYTRACYDGAPYDYGFKYDATSQTLEIKPWGESQNVVMQGTTPGTTGIVYNQTHCPNGVQKDDLKQVKKLVIHEGIVQISQQAFCYQKALKQYEQLEEVELPDSLEKICSQAFKNTKIVTIDCKNTKVFDSGVFDDCALLTKISFNSADITITNKLLNNKATSMKQICFNGTTEQWTKVLEQIDNTMDPVTATLSVHCKQDPAPTPATCTEAGDKTSDCAVCGGTYKDENGTENPAEGHKYSETYEVDKAATCTEAGSESQHCIRCNAIDTASIKEIPATGHKYSKWITTTKATVFTPAVQTSTCDICKKNTTTRKYGSKLNPTIKVSAETVLLKTSQKTSALKVTGLANGDSVKSYQSGNTKLFTVDKKGVITATKKTGNAKLTITLASGLKKNVTVKVQKKAVATTKITGLQSKVTVQKGAKLTLKPSRLPITSTQKFTYASSNKKVATVSSAGVIKAKAAGTAKITVKSGNKKVVVTVTVPKTKTTAITVKTSVTVKKGKTIALNAKKTPANSDQKITYTSANKKIATVTSAGKIKSVKKGTTTITVKSGSVTKKVQVTVK